MCQKNGKNIHLRESTMEYFHLLMPPIDDKKRQLWIEKFRHSKYYEMIKGNPQEF